MKTHVRNLFLLPVLVAGFGLIPVGGATAQIFTNLHNFAYAPSDGVYPSGGVILSGNRLFGMASGGGSSDAGMVFAVNTDGTGFTNLHSFIGSDGGVPGGRLILSGNTLYGTASAGGSMESGTVFAVNTNGSGFTVLHHFATAAPDPSNLFTNSDGFSPGELILSGNTLYGTAYRGGSADSGTVFAVRTNGTGFTNLHSFTSLFGPGPSTNSDGARPIAGLVVSGDTLYGVAGSGGSSGNGTVFKLNTNGTGFTTLHSFAPLSGPYPPTNSDGALPLGKLILSGNTLYGTTSGGGSSGNGTLFSINTDGTGFTKLHNFAALPPVPGPSTNSDGAGPRGGLILSGNTLFGTAAYGGSMESGTMFVVNTDGSGFATLFNFAATSPPNLANSTGFGPAGGLILSGNTLYGTARQGGSLTYGTVFSLTLPPPPPLTISPSGANVFLRWPTNAFGFGLQSTTNLVSSAVWSTVSPAPVVVNGQNTVTNSILGAQKFYRLSQ